jgi:hypothetical protein
MAGSNAGANSKSVDAAKMTFGVTWQPLLIQQHWFMW